jgi:hypothetical protein
VYIIFISSGIITTLKSRNTKLSRFLFGTKSSSNSPSQAKGMVHDISVALVIFMAIFSLVAYYRYIGRWEAQHRQEFYTVNNFPNLPESLVVMSLSDEYIVTASFDRATREVERKIYLINQAEMGNTPLSFEKIGPLKVKP